MMAENRQRSGGSFTGLFIVGAVIWLLFFGGLSTVKRLTDDFSIGRVQVEPTAKPVATTRPLPTVAQPAQPVQPAAPAAQPTQVVIIPQGQPKLPAAPTAVPTAIPVVTPLPQEFYQAPTPVLAVGAPAIGPAECNSQNAKFKGEKDVSLLRDASNPASAVPIGHIAAWSCTSQDEVVAELRQREVKMVEDFKAKYSS